MSDEATRRYATLTFARGAVVALALALLGGLLSVLYYVPATRAVLRALGLDFAALRPLHTTFASAWIFLGGLAVVHRYLEDAARELPVTRGERWRLRLTVSLWAVAGAGILITLPLGITSGREYMGFHPLLSLPILLGWLLFAWNFFRATWRGFWSRPVYVSMWGVGAAFFVVTFSEQHLWLLPGVFSDPVVDLRLQWKACGTLVGSFNLFVYGSLYYIAERLTGDERYAHSRLAYGLFGVGLLNSFTNFAHHTYHLPQSETVKWISFVISMTEMVILARVVWDLGRAVASKAAEQTCVAGCFLKFAKWWTAAMLFGSVLISIPPLNSFIHGTHVVTGHAMGTEIGIDSMVLFGAVVFLLSEILRRRGQDAGPLHDTRARGLAYGVHVSAALVVTWLTLSGLIVGVTRYRGLPPPEWLTAANPYLFAGAGALLFSFLVVLLSRWLRVLFWVPATDPASANVGGAAVQASGQAGPAPELS